MSSIHARHELLTPTGWRDAECSCGLWFGTGSSFDQLFEDYQTHRDDVDKAESQRLDRGATWLR